jgi:DNA-binding NarL/FixJ family response regulator
VRIFVVEESPAPSGWLLERLKSAPELAIVGAACGVTDAVRAILRLSPDLVVIETELSDGVGLALLHVLQARRAAAGTGPRLLLWTGCRDARRLAVAYGLGAEASFDKVQDAERLVEYCRQGAPRHG